MPPRRSTVRSPAPLSLVVEGAEEVGSGLAVDVGGGASVVVEGDAEVAEAVGDDAVVAVHHFLGRAALLACADGDGHAVLVGAADEEHLAALQAEVADVDVGRHVDAGEVAYVYTAVGVGQGCRHQRAGKFVLFHVACDIFGAKLYKRRERAKGLALFL